MVLVMAGCTAGRPAPTVPPSPTTHAATSLDVPRAVHRATVLPDGRVLLTGGCTAAGCEDADRARRTEIYDPGTGRIGFGPQLHVPRLSHTATRLPDGRVLIIGGYAGEGEPPTAAMELVDVEHATVTPAGALRVARADHTATLLRDGRVLVAGGRDAGGNPLRSAEIVEPAAQRTTVTTDLPQPTTAADAVLVGPRVLVIGGTSSTDDAVASTAWFDPEDARWTAGPELLRPRVKHAAVALPNGVVLVAGGAASVETRDRFDDTELLDPGATAFRHGPRLTDGRYKLADAAAVFDRDRVVLGGGATLDVVDVGLGTTRSIPVPGLAQRLSFQSVTRLPGSRVLVAGGYDDAIVPSDILRVVPIP